MKKFISLPIVVSFFTVLTPLISLQADQEDNIIGVYSAESRRIKYFNSDGSRIARGRLALFFKSRLPAERYISAQTAIDIDASEPGVEWIHFLDFDKNSLVVTTQSRDTVLDRLHIFAGNNSRWSSVALGDFMTDYPGSEIAVCPRNVSQPRIKIVSYTTTDGLREVAKLNPFNTAAIKQGCDAIVIGDMDGDGVNELIVAIEDTIVLLNAEGETVNKFNNGASKLNLLEQDGVTYLLTLDTYFSREIFFLTSEGEIANEINIGPYLRNRIGDIVVANVDTDDEEEIVVRERGRAAQVHIFNQNGVLEKSFETYSNTKIKKDRFLFIAPFVF